MIVENASEVGVGPSALDVFGLPSLEPVPGCLSLISMVLGGDHIPAISFLVFARVVLGVDRVDQQFLVQFLLCGR